jgi:hypothetical protein
MILRVVLPVHRLLIHSFLIVLLVFQICIYIKPEFTRPRHQDADELLVGGINNDATMRIVDAFRLQKGIKLLVGLVRVEVRPFVERQPLDKKFVAILHGSMFILYGQFVSFIGFNAGH